MSRERGNSDCFHSAFGGFPSAPTEVTGYPLGSAQSTQQWLQKWCVAVLRCSSPPSAVAELMWSPNYVCKINTRPHECPSWKIYQNTKPLAVFLSELEVTVISSLKMEQWGLLVVGIFSDFTEVSAYLRSCLQKKINKQTNKTLV